MCENGATNDVASALIASLDDVWKDIEFDTFPDHDEKPKYRKTLELVRKKIIDVSSLTGEFAKVSKLNLKLSKEISSLKKEKQDLIRKQNLDLEKITKLELDHSECRQSLRKQKETIEAHQIKLEENQKHIHQLVSKIKGLEDESKTFEVKIAKLKATEKKPKAAVKHQECQTQDIQKQDVSINTNPVRKPTMVDKSEWTDECITISKEPFPIFCTNCKTHINPSPIDQILKIMTAEPPVQLSPPCSPRKQEIQIEENNSTHTEIETKDVFDKNMFSILDGKKYNKIMNPAAPIKLRQPVALQETKHSFMEIDKLRKQIVKLKSAVKNLKSETTSKSRDNNTCCSKNIQIFLQYPETSKKHEKVKIKPQKRLMHKIKKQPILSKNKWQIENCLKSKKEKKHKGKKQKKKAKNIEVNDLFDSPEICIPCIKTNRAPDFCLSEDSQPSISNSQSSMCSSRSNICSIENMDIVSHETETNKEIRPISESIAKEIDEFDLILQKIDENCKKKTDISEHTERIELQNLESPLSTTKFPDLIKDNMNSDTSSSNDKLQDICCIKSNIDIETKNEENINTCINPFSHLSKIETTKVAFNTNKIPNLTPMDRDSVELFSENKSLNNNLDMKLKVQTSQGLLSINDDEANHADNINNLYSKEKFKICEESLSNEKPTINIYNNDLMAIQNDVLLNQTSQDSASVDNKIDNVAETVYNSFSNECLKIFKMDVPNNPVTTEVNNEGPTPTECLEQNTIENQSSLPLVSIEDTENDVVEKIKETEFTNNSSLEESIKVNKNLLQNNDLTTNNSSSDLESMKEDTLENQTSSHMNSELDVISNNKTDDTSENVNNLISEETFKTSTNELKDNQLCTVPNPVSRFPEEDVNINFNTNSKTNKLELINKNLFGNTCMILDAQTFEIIKDTNNVNLSPIDITSKTNEIHDKNNELISEVDISLFKQENVDIRHNTHFINNNLDSNTSLSNNNTLNDSNLNILDVQTSSYSETNSESKIHKEEKDVESVNKSSPSIRYVSMEKFQKSINLFNPYKRSYATNKRCIKRLKLDLPVSPQIDSVNNEKIYIDKNIDKLEFTNGSILPNTACQTNIIKSSEPFYNDSDFNMKKNENESLNIKDLDVKVQTSINLTPVVNLEINSNLNDEDNDNLNNSSFEDNLSNSQIDLHSNESSIILNDNSSLECTLEEVDNSSTKKKGKRTARSTQLDTSQSPSMALRSRQVPLDRKNSKKKASKKTPCPNFIDSTNSCLGDSTVASLLNECVFKGKNTKKILRNSRNDRVLLEYKDIIHEQMDILMNCETWTTEINDQVINHLTSLSNFRMTASYVLEYAATKETDDDELDKTHTPPAPMMTRFEQKIVVLVLGINKEYPEFTDIFLQGIEYKLFRLGQPITVQFVERFFRIFLVLNKIRKNREKVRIAICDALYCLKNRAVDIIMIAMSGWSEVFPSFSSNKDILVKTIVHLVMTMNVDKPSKKLSNCRKWLSTVYEYPSSGYVLKELVAELLAGLQDNVPGTHTAILLLSKRMDSDWALKNIVPAIEWALVNQRNCPSLYERLLLLGNIFRSFLPTNSNQMEKVTKKIEQLRDIVLENSESDDLQEGAISFLLSISKFKFEEIAQIVLNWQYKKELRPSTKDKLCSFLKSHDAPWWWHFINFKLKSPKTTNYS